MAEVESIETPADPFLEAVGRVVLRLEDVYGPLYAAMLAHLPDRPSDEWVFLVGSPGLVKRRMTGISAVVHAMKGIIPREFSTRIRHVDVLSTEDPLYDRLSRAFDVQPGKQAELIQCSVFGTEIEHAVLYVMRKPVGNPRRTTRTRRAAIRRTNPATEA